MSNRSAHTQTVALLIVIAVGSSAVARQAGQPAAPAQAPAQASAAAGQGSAQLNVSQMPLPVRGVPYRFSLCLGRLLNPGEVSAPCRTAQSNAAQTVGGTAGNGVVTFRLENGSFLPPGLTLDGFGVISGTTSVDLTKLTIKICAIQLGTYGTNFNCKGKPVGFGKETLITPPTPPAPATPATSATGGGSSGGKMLGVLAGSAAAAGAGLYAAKQLSGLSGPDCSPQRSALDGAMATLNSAMNSLLTCGSSPTCISSRVGAVNSAISSIANTGGNYCTCMGGAQIPAAEKAAMQSLLQSASALSSTSLPSCFQ